MSYERRGITCKKCNEKFHGCSSCNFDKADEFHIYELGICFKCFTDTGIEDEYWEFRNWISEQEDNFTNNCLKKLELK